MEPSIWHQPFRLFFGYGIIQKWHAPDHTKIEAFRSRLSPETQRQLANLISQHVTRLGYANPSELEVLQSVATDKGYYSYDKYYPKNAIKSAVKSLLMMETCA